jgi:hypothetical protein
MSAHNTLQELANANYEVVDPGDAATFNVDRSPYYVALVTAAAETRTLAAPSKAGMIFLASMKTDGGDLTLTVSGGFDEAGSTTVVFHNTGEVLGLISVVGGGTTYAWRVLFHDGVTGIASDLDLGDLSVDTLTIAGQSVDATATELNRAADVSSKVVNATASTLVVTEAAHSGRTILLDRAAGIAVTLPAASAGLEFTFIVKTTFTGAATIKSVTGADVMIGQALLGNNTDNAVVAWQSLASSTNDTIDLFGTSNSTGGIEGEVIKIRGLAANLWHVDITGDAAGTEATPFANTVA